MKKRKETPEELFWRAEKRFNPQILAKYAVKKDKTGRFIVDKSKAIETPEDVELFYSVLQEHYGWRWNCGCEIEDATIYFDVCGGLVFGGVWSVSKDDIVTNHLIIDCEEHRAEPYSPYIYNRHEMEKFVDNLL